MGWRSLVGTQRGHGCIKHWLRRCGIGGACWQFVQARVRSAALSAAAFLGAAAVPRVHNTLPGTVLWCFDCALPYSRTRILLEMYGEDRQVAWDHTDDEHSIGADAGYHAPVLKPPGCGAGRYNQVQRHHQGYCMAVLVLASACRHPYAGSKFCTHCASRRCARMVQAVANPSPVPSWLSPHGDWDVLGAFSSHRQRLPFTDNAPDYYRSSMTANPLQ